MNRIVTIGLTLLVIAAARDGAGADDGLYVWPLEESRSLSSLFGDYRPGRHHGGVDIRTNGRTGYPVRAADTGYVWRVTTGYWGYGKAVYLRLLDGRIAVYGHLREFPRAVREYLLDNQYDAERYKTNLFPAPGQFPVGRGAVIGTSGQTGGVPPHLHFEVRTRDNKPLNPLQYGFQCPDDQYPEIAAVHFEPTLVGHAGTELPTVNGLPLSRRFATRSTEAGHYVLDSVPVLSGKIGIAIEAIDHVDSRAFGGPPYEYRLLVNGAPTYTCALDSFSYDHSPQIVLDRVIDGPDKPRARRLCRMPGNELAHTRSAVNEGFIELDPAEDSNPLVAGRNELRIEVEDVSGNRAHVEGAFIYAAAPRLRSATMFEDGGVWRVRLNRADPARTEARWRLEGWTPGASEWIVVRSGTADLAPGMIDLTVGADLPPHHRWRIVVATTGDASGQQEEWVGVRFDEPQTVGQVVDHYPPKVNWRDVPGGVVGTWDAPLALTVAAWGDQEKSRRLPSLCRSDGRCAIFLGGGGSYDSVLWFEVTGAMTPESPRPVVLPRKAVGAGDEARVESADGTASVVFQPGDVYYSLFAGIAQTGFPRKAVRPLTGTYRFTPRHVPFRRAVRIAMSVAGLAADPAKLGLYRLTEDGEWEFVGNDYDPAEDVIEARVTLLGDFAILEDGKPPIIRNVRPGKGSKTRETRPTITFEMWDALSGFGAEDDLTMTIGDRWVPVEYDPRRKVGKARPRWDLAPGQHMVVVTARDRAGNADRFRRLLRIVR